MATSSHTSQAAAVTDKAHHDVVAGRTLSYLSGFGAEHATEALPGALPVGQNAPQKCPYGLYAEQLSGTAFTMPRHRNQRSWLYRVRPSVMHDRLVPAEHPGLVPNFASAHVDPNQMRWLPMPMPAEVSAASAAASSSSSAAAGAGVDKIDWVDGLRTMAGNGDPTAKSGLAIYMYACNASMEDAALYNSDGDFLIVPQAGTLRLQTEMGFLDVAPNEIAVVPRGIAFRVAVDGPCRGYVCEIYSGHFQLPDLGPIGANGLANPRDFLAPVAAYEDRDVQYVLLNKFGGKLFSTTKAHSPFNVVAWHGNYYPYKYDLSLFNTMNSVSYDHPDPSIYTVLTAPTDTPGTALCDFVIFPPRWMVMDHSFRPPYYHRNVMSEFMGMVWGKYDAKVGFQPGGASLHSIGTAHGPDTDTFVKASTEELAPQKFGAGLAFMFESTLMLKLTDWALDAPHRDVDYQKCWRGLPRVFDPAKREVAPSAIKAGADSGKGGTCGSATGHVISGGVSLAVATAAAGSSHEDDHAHKRRRTGAGAGSSS